MKSWLILSLASLVLSACSVVGDFCDVVQGPKEFSSETAEVLVRNDRDMAQQIQVENSYGYANCSWEVNDALTAGVIAPFSANVSDTVY